jgi:hypothetical protein
VAKLLVYSYLAGKVDHFRLYSSRSLYLHLIVNFTAFTSPRPPNLHGGIGHIYNISLLKFGKVVTKGLQEVLKGSDSINPPASYLYVHI